MDNSFEQKKNLDDGFTSKLVIDDITEKAKQSAMNANTSLSLSKNQRCSKGLLKTQDIAPNTSSFIPQQCNFSNFFECDLEEYYKIDKKIGKGACGEVYQGFCKLSGKKVAIKVIKLENSEILADSLKEIEILQSLDHPNIMKILQIFKSKKELQIVSEFYSGPSLRNYIESNDVIEEKTLAKILKQILRALNYLRKKSIIHKDIKADNIIFADASLSQIKIIDFGFATKIKQNQKFSKSENMKGTPFYFAPEYLKFENYEENDKVDMWSLGVLVYWIVTHEMPFNGTDFKELFVNILTKEPSYDHLYFQLFTPEFKEFLKCLLEKDPKKRLNAKKALSSGWIKKSTKKDVSISRNLLQNFNTFLIYQTEQKKPLQTFQVLKFICNNILEKSSDENLKKIRKNFCVFDFNNTGKIQTDFLIKSIQSLDQSKDYSSLLENQQFLPKKIGYSDFLTMFMPLEEVLTQKNLLVVFKMLDQYNSKQVQIEQIKQINPILKSCKYTTDSQNSNNLIDIEQFIKLFL